METAHSQGSIPQLYHLSVKGSLIGKDNRNSAKGWKEAHLTIPQIARHSYIEGRGIATGIFKDGHKINDNWQSAQLAVIDIDKGAVTLDELLADKHIASHALLIYPSSSHEPEINHRWHIAIAFNQVVKDPDLWAYNVRLFQKMMSFEDDPSAKDYSRYFAGTVFNKPSLKGHKKQLDDGMVYINEDAEHVLLSPVPLPMAASAQAYKIISKNNPSAYDGIIDDDKVAVVLAGLGANPLAANANGWVSIHCPHHTDANPSASVNIHTGIVNCFTCHGDKGRGFSPDETLEVLGIEYTTPYAPRNEGKPTHTINTRFVSRDDMPETGKALLIQSPTGTGKTVLSKQYAVSQTWAVAHRVKLIDGMVNRYHSADVSGVMCGDIRHYKDIAPDERGGNDSRAICVNSLALHSIDHLHHVDTLIVDEIASVLEAFNSNTMNGLEKLSNYVTFREMVKRARKVVAMDANMNGIVTKVLDMWGIEYDYVRNEYTPEYKVPCSISDDATKVIERALEQAHKGIFTPVFCASKAKAESIADTAKQRGLKVMLITSDTAYGADEQHFLQAIVNKEADDLDAANAIAHYDMLVYTSVISTGVDINYPVQDVFMIADHNTLAANDLVQGIGRFRNKAGIDAFIPVSNDNSKRLTNPTIFRHIFIETWIKTNVAVGYAPDGKAVREMTPDQQELLEILACMESDRQYSLAHLREDFQHKTSGYLDHSIISETPSKALQADMWESRERLTKERKEAVLASPVLPYDEYKWLARKDNKTIDEILQVEHSRMYHAVGRTITASDYDLLKGEGISKLILCRDVRYDTLDDMIRADKTQHEYEMAVQDYSHFTLKYTDINTVMSLAFGNDWRTSPSEYADLQSIADYKPLYYKGRRGSSNPARLLTRILKAIGLRSERTRITNELGERVRCYSVVLDGMWELAKDARKVQKQRENTIF